MPEITQGPIIVIAPDSFKGSLDAKAVAEAMARGVHRALPNAVVRICPMADGGEGTLDAMLSCSGTRKHLIVRGAGRRDKTADIGITPSGVAIVETAGIVGITDPVGMSATVEERSTYGVGEAIHACLDLGIRRICVALGGTSTNDGGAGMLAALGMRLFDSAGTVLEPTLSQLSRIERAEFSGLDERLRDATIVGMSDVDNPLTGERGATAVFGQQKGVAADRIAAHDFTLTRFADLVEAGLGCSRRNEPGAGAAGGLGFALLMIGGRLESGAEIVAREIALEAALEDADWLITGEGRSDRQTLGGKTPFVCCGIAGAANVPATLLSGSLDPESLPALNEHFSGCFSPICGPMTLQRAIECAPTLLEQASEQLVRMRYTRRLRASDEGSTANVSN
ncbi:glycerate kinase [Burkholderia sp. Bp9143]|uniref:glycerate kinase n=1 Tax=Burkholderia sp. Bp9143 TaxID=2184574 RepID=UPI000F5A196A|nr:glycerate kinase [Burkholderia sp. Bp9143]RQR27739.1 glycerate kinase [Burkholderia sp. Bp9143]